MRCSEIRCPHCGRKIPEGQMKIMKAFDEAQEPLAQYKLAKKSGICYRQVLRILHQLEAIHYIEKDHTEPSSTKSLDRIFWRRARGDSA